MGLLNFEIRRKRRERLITKIILTCHCGEEMTAIIEAEEEVLYFCNNEKCESKAMINVITRGKARAWDIQNFQMEKRNAKI